MPFAYPSSQQVITTVFGGEFVAEQHRDEKIWNLSSSPTDLVKSLTVSMFDAMMQSLKATLTTIH